MQFNRPVRSIAAAALLLAACFTLPAQDTYFISVKLRDGRTGLPVKADNFLVRIDHHDTILNEAVKMNDDGTVFVTVPGDTKEISFKATYDASTEIYINCDAAKQSDKERDIWYPIATILRSGVVAPNECGKTDYTAKPGEFVFFVRKRDWRDGLGK